ncbi:MAG: efflux RND transporter periplasmic adaptor subunit [Chitinophagaceae bacterium]|nr:MAG: RND family efflux transporter MFP subunit [Bacteroidetes bacterium OLB11]MCC6448096.1 efflux RND transporter periplasmic adaptor subunit [Chitinophagaceae bacterium]HMN33402.1 efflux RND transporter periplasmic adaptor subunit [Chitinophagaceae bacterium]
MNILKSTISITIFSALLAACGGSQSKNPETELVSLKKQQKEIQEKIAKLEASQGKKDSIRVTPVEVISMTPSVFKNYIDVQGKVDIDEVVNAIPETPGIIQSILVKPGQYVSKGQVVATLRSETIDRGVAQLDQQINFAKILYEKQKRLWDQEIGTEVQLLTAKNQYENLLKQKQMSLSQKQSFNVYSPINGIVDAVNATVGQSFANPVNAPVIRIVNTNKLKIKANVAENYAGIVHTGSNTMLIFPDIRDTLITKINYAERTIDPITRTFATYISLSPNPRFQPNMTAQVKIATYENNRAWVLPIAVIQKTDQGDFVYKVDEKNKALLVPVTLGNTYMGNVEILSGLNLGDKIITVGYDQLNNNDPVLIANTPQ